MAHTRTTERSAAEQWFRGHVMTRFFATMWWVVMAAVTIGVASSVTNLAVRRTPGHVASVALMLIIFIPIYREWPNWRRLGRMLRHGT